MKVIQRIVEFFNRSNQNEIVEMVPCSVCWGREEYEGKYHQPTKTYRSSKLGWIAEYATNYLYKN